MTVTITDQLLSSIPVGNCIQCLGSHSNHTLELKFAALQKGGWKHTEFSFAEYFRWVRDKEPQSVPDVDPETYGDGEQREGEEAAWETLYRYAPQIKALAARHDVKMWSLQCLGQVDSWPAGSIREARGKQKAVHWIELCKHLGLEFCQIGVNDQYEAVAPFEKTVEDLRWIAERAAERGIKIAYESWNFAPKNNQWEATWDVVKAANHPNLGLCIDTAQCALAPAYGFDPTSGRGFTEPAVAALLQRLAALPADKIFFVEISDVLRPSPALLCGSPFDQWHLDQGPGYRTGFTWCRCARVIPHIGRGTGKLVQGQDGLGAGRTSEIVKAILSTGFEGPMLYECFEVSEQEKAETSIPDELVRASVLSWQRMSQAMLD
ncbi:uncharacterized protein I303_103843 [Kwoniella dejecticola CBS 10117]|uniref:Xylose isomerase-like TIM barrel domain-containing protein n=1 Tax=Kwoniella dejecticola CBS 10117 TaxID=1296121 RepID=A0A1A6A7W2_9TREE|nr:uncharacterized protein I303_03862 [Kwoniella dejecticola CBS 10117]OBR86142.1 hypothetical protein I303_03862 [Kwoniella dejecticola CBS 10117]